MADGGQLVFDVKLNLQKVEQEGRELQKKFDQKPISLHLRVDDSEIKNLARKIENGIPPIKLKIDPQAIIQQIQQAVKSVGGGSGGSSMLGGISTGALVASIGAGIAPKQIGTNLAVGNTSGQLVGQTSQMSVQRMDLGQREINGGAGGVIEGFPTQPSMRIGAGATTLTVPNPMLGLPIGSPHGGAIQSPLIDPSRLLGWYDEQGNNFNVISSHPTQSGGHYFKAKSGDMLGSMTIDAQGNIIGTSMQGKSGGARQPSYLKNDVRSPDGAIVKAEVAQAQSSPIYGGTRSGAWYENGMATRLGREAHGHYEPFTGSTQGWTGGFAPGNGMPIAGGGGGGGGGWGSAVGGYFSSRFNSFKSMMSNNYAKGIGAYMIASTATDMLNAHNQYNATMGHAVGSGDYWGAIQAQATYQQQGGLSALPIVGGLGSAIREFATGDIAALNRTKGEVDYGKRKEDRNQALMELKLNEQARTASLMGTYGGRREAITLANASRLSANEAALAKGVNEIEEKYKAQMLANPGSATWKTYAATALLSPVGLGSVGMSMGREGGTPMLTQEQQNAKDQEIKKLQEKHKAIADQINQQTKLSHAELARERQSMSLASKYDDAISANVGRNNRNIEELQINKQYDVLMAREVDPQRRKELEGNRASAVNALKRTWELEDKSNNLLGINDRQAQRMLIEATGNQSALNAFDRQNAFSDQQGIRGATSALAGTMVNANQLSGRRLDAISGRGSLGRFDAVTSTVNATRGLEVGSTAYVNAINSGFAQWNNATVQQRAEMKQYGLDMYGMSTSIASGASRYRGNFLEANMIEATGRRDMALAQTKDPGTIRRVNAMFGLESAVNQRQEAVRSGNVAIRTSLIEAEGKTATLLSQGKEFGATIQSLKAQTDADIRSIQLDDSLNAQEKQKRIDAVNARFQGKMKEVQTDIARNQSGGVAGNIGSFLNYAGAAYKGVNPPEDLQGANRDAQNAANAMNVGAAGAKGQVAAEQAVRDAVGKGVAGQGAMNANEKGMMNLDPKVFGDMAEFLRQIRDSVKDSLVVQP